jgi:hypothetical protein
MTILSVADATAIRDDLTKALIEIDAWKRSKADADGQAACGTEA